MTCASEDRSAEQSYCAGHPERSGVRIGVWNLECVSFKDRNPARLDFLRNHDADIWVLTETHTEIDLSSSHPHSVHSRRRERSRNDMYWVSIWSRFPVVEAVNEPDVRSAIALLDTPIGRLLVYGTVWPWHSDTGEHPGDPAWTNWLRQAPVIMQQASHWQQLRADWPDSILCVAGDLNMTFGGPNSYYSREGRLEAALAMQAHDLVCTTAWPRLPQGTLETSPIDHVLLPHEWAMRTSVCETWPGHPRQPDRLSDHSGLIVQITQPETHTPDAMSDEAPL
jgi:hypothetical protein